MSFFIYGVGICINLLDSRIVSRLSSPTFKYFDGGDNIKIPSITLKNILRTWLMMNLL